MKPYTGATLPVASVDIDMCKCLYVMFNLAPLDWGGVIDTGNPAENGLIINAVSYGAAWGPPSGAPSYGTQPRTIGNGFNVAGYEREGVNYPYPPYTPPASLDQVRADWAAYVATLHTGTHHGGG
jgi:hypothetical protein